LRLWTSVETGDEPGLVMIQIDGLSRHQLERALTKGRMPFLKRLLQREGYELHTLYSGIPSTTPAVQAELFYGRQTAVPAFSFREQATGEIIRMVEPQPAMRRQQELERQGEGLLAGGSAYSDIYSGGAAESHFCPAAMGWGHMLESATLPRSLLVLLWNVMSLFRTGALFVVELFLAVIDAVRGLVAGRSVWEEIKFVPSRVAVGVLLRELIAIGAEIDATRGLPIIHLNLLGYDEQAHRRGPGSVFAHWSLRQIDKSIQRICDGAFCSPRRDYQVWIYSDHGQEATVPYVVLRGKTLQRVLLEIWDEAHANQPPSSHSFGIETHRAAWLGGGFLQALLPKAVMEKLLIDAGVPISADKGPVAHIYWPETLAAEERDRIARQLVDDEQVPLVFAVDDAVNDDETVAVWSPEGRHQLPRDRDIVFGADHPFLDELTRDWIALCRHPGAGTLVASGWRQNGQCISFVTENGAHAGPGFEETRAFALLPREAPLPETDNDFLRPRDLRQAARCTLGRDPAAKRSRRSSPQRPVETLRIMTYNVHSCIGVDGKLSPRRIARLIAQWQPDIVALQELDVGRSRTGGMDQAHLIAHELGMEFHFHPAIHVEEEKYGDAILSRFPVRQMHAAALPNTGGRAREPRGALWVTVDTGTVSLQVINTHLGLSRRERLAQVRALLGEEWLRHPECTDSVILCGDFNAGPASPEYREITQYLTDAQLLDAQTDPRTEADTAAQTEAQPHTEAQTKAGTNARTGIGKRRPRNTWTSTYPLRRIDHIFLRGNVSVLGIEVPRSRLARVASDHLPLLVELRAAEVDSPAVAVSEHYNEGA